jgi:hypothetical protein
MLLFFQNAQKKKQLVFFKRAAPDSMIKYHIKIKTAAIWFQQG